MARRRLSEEVSPIGRIVIIIVTALAALVILFLTLSRPSRPATETEVPFGAPGTTQPADSAK